MVASLSPEDFMEGCEGYGLPLPHVQLQTDVSGKIYIQTTSLAIGYYSGPGELRPLAQHNGWYHPGDLGWQNEAGHLHLTGRASDVILSGGENIWPAEVEAAIRSAAGVEDVVVLGWPDREWGERVVAVVVANCCLEVLKGAIAPLLAPYKRPKQWLRVDGLPRNDQGKLIRESLQHLVNSAQWRSTQVDI
jgi:O-succinylbenzoic acid--CoA ligase